MERAEETIVEDKGVRMMELRIRERIIGRLAGRKGVAETQRGGRKEITRTMITYSRATVAVGEAKGGSISEARAKADPER